MVAETGPALMPLLGTAYVLPRDRSLYRPILQELMRTLDPTNKGYLSMWVGFFPVVYLYDADLIQDVISTWIEPRPCDAARRP